MLCGDAGENLDCANTSCAWCIHCLWETPAFEIWGATEQHFIYKQCCWKITWEKMNNKQPCTLRKEWCHSVDSSFTRLSQMSQILELPGSMQHLRRHWLCVCVCLQWSWIHNRGGDRYSHRGLALGSQGENMLIIRKCKHPLLTDRYGVVDNSPFF